MNFFKEIITILTTAASFCFGWGIGDLITGDHNRALWMFFAAAIIFAVGFFEERLSK